MARMEVKAAKIKDMKFDDGAMADYEDLTATDDDFEEEERDRFQQFLKERKEDKESGQKFYGDDKALREKEGYDDDYMGSLKDEERHQLEETERITDMLRREKPKSDRLRDAELTSKYQKEIEVMDKVFMEDTETDYKNMRNDMESERLDMKELNRIYGEEQKVKDQFFYRREKKQAYKQQGTVKKESPVWDDED